MPARLNELAILITARAWDAQFEWWAHHRLALEAGLDPAVAADIAEGRRPASMQADEAVVYDFCTELRTTRRVSDATLAAALDLLGEQGVIELIAVCGYYDMVSMTLNVAEVPLPDGVEPPLKPLRRTRAGVTPEGFRALALSLPQATEGEHDGLATFLVRGRRFATLGWPEPHKVAMALSPRNRRCCWTCARTPSRAPPAASAAWATATSTSPPPTTPPSAA